MASACLPRCIQVLAAAREASIWPLSPADRPWWGRSSPGALSDCVEWREWFELLARRSLALQTKGEAGATSGGTVAPQGDARARGTLRYWRWQVRYESDCMLIASLIRCGTLRYWRWQGAHLVRYVSWPAGKRYDGKTPALLLVHGFAASAEQWERLVHAMRALGDPDALPPIYALDLVGFGHSEKPGISYTQYTWEAQLVDFAAEVLPDGLGWPRMASLTACRCSRARPSCSRAIASDCMLIATLIRCSRARPSCSQAIASAVASWRARPRRSARRCAAWCCATRRGSSSNDV